MHVSIRPTQAERRARSRSALLEAAARGLSRYGYGDLVLEQVAREAGYTRGALYHQFKDKEDLALAVIEWVNENWMREVGAPATQEPDPVAALIALARGHAVYCRRDVARFAMALRLEFSGQDHPVGRELERILETGVKRAARLINAGRRDGSIPPGPPARAVALALFGALEGAVIAPHLGGAVPIRGLDEVLAHLQLVAAATEVGAADPDVVRGDATGVVVTGRAAERLDREGLRGELRHGGLEGLRLLLPGVRVVAVAQVVEDDVLGRVVHAPRREQAKVTVQLFQAGVVVVGHERRRLAEPGQAVLPHFDDQGVLNRDRLPG